MGPPGIAGVACVIARHPFSVAKLFMNPIFPPAPGGRKKKRAVLQLTEIRWGFAQQGLLKDNGSVFFHFGAAA